MDGRAGQEIALCRWATYTHMHMHTIFLVHEVIDCRLEGWGGQILLLQVIARAGDPCRRVAEWAVSFQSAAASTASPLPLVTPYCRSHLRLPCWPSPFPTPSRKTSCRNPTGLALPAFSLSSPLSHFPLLARHLLLVLLVAAVQPGFDCLGFSSHIRAHIHTHVIYPWIFFQKDQGPLT